MYNRKLFTGLLAAGLLFMVGCKKDKDNVTTVLISTTNITNIAGTSTTDPVSATSGGDIEVVGSESITERGVVWALTPKPTTANNKATSGSGKGNFSANLTGLTFGSDYYVRAYVINNGQTHYGNEMKFTASPPVEIIKNGGFESADPNVALINSNNWKTDETDGGIIGRSTNAWTNTAAIWANGEAKGFYQVVGTVPASAADYAIKLDINCSYRDWDPAAILSVTFSAYSGNDLSTREIIGTAEFGGTILYNGWDVSNWVTKTATFSLPAGSSHAGKNLVVEFDISSYIPPAGEPYYNPGAWYDFDNASVIQTLK